MSGRHAPSEFGCFFVVAQKYSLMQESRVLRVGAVFKEHPDDSETVIFHGLVQGQPAPAVHKRH